jgi:hypothetical protein
MKLLGILREANSQASQTLDEAGVTLREVRRIMAQEPENKAERRIRVVLALFDCRSYGQPVKDH